MTDETASFAQFLIADGQQKCVQSYVDRGRAFQSASDEFLLENYLIEMKNWALTPPPWEPLTKLDDIGAECELRHLDLSVIGKEINQYLDIIYAVMEKKGPILDANSGHLDRRLAEYEEMKARKN